MPAEARPEGAARCNECNEALQAARDALAVARRLSQVAKNAVLSGDLKRACSALQALQDAAWAGLERGSEPARGLELQ
jgi:hypothetical protein